MSIQWEETTEEIQALLGSEEFDPGGKMYKFLLKWGNRVIRDICMEIDIRAHFQQSCSIVLTTSDASVTLPSIFFKMSQRFTRARVGENYIEIIGLDKLYEKDPDHNDTSSADEPDAVSIEGNRLYVYPMVSATLYLENYFRRPTDMVSNTSSPDVPDDTALQDLLISGVCKKAFQWMQDFDAKREYEADYLKYLNLYSVHIDKTNSMVNQPAKFY